MLLHTDVSFTTAVRGFQYPEVVTEEGLLSAATTNSRSSFGTAAAAMIL